MSKVLGLDVGSSTIGVAVSDTLGWTAQGVTTIRRKDMQHDLKSLQRLIRQHNISEVVVGIPFKKNGKMDSQTRKIIHFMNVLRNAFRLPIYSWDERFSTVEASKALQQGHVKKKKKAALIDQVAATIILQGYLDHKNDGK